MYSWGVLFLVSTYEIRRLQAIDLSLNEQSPCNLIYVVAMSEGKIPFFTILYKPIKQDPKD
jgi:hypothetical protein